MRKFINVDGVYGRKLIPFPHNPHFNPEVAKYDKMSFADRFKEIEHDLTSLERYAFEGFLSITSGGTLENSSFFEMLRWWALNNYDMTLFMEQCLTFKFRIGQSAFARKFFDEADATGNLDYVFGEPVAAIDSTAPSSTKVSLKNGREFKAQYTVCTIPLNVLNTIQFTPALASGKSTAANLGHVNRVSKLHVECANPELRSFSGITYPKNKLAYMFGDGTTPAGNTHLVSFGPSMPGMHLQPEDDVQDTMASVQRFEKMDVKRLVWHNW